jgi:soluble lytic murein transglycosylase-like protein
MGLNSNKPGPAKIAIAILISLFFLTVDSSFALAAPFVRVCKDGVIYYYFSTRGEAGPETLSPNRPQVRRPPPPALPHLAPQELDPLIQEAGRQHHLPPALIKAVIRVESDFNPAATSPKGAQGLMQLMPGTADDLQVSNPYDIRENIWGGTRYLGMLLQKFNNRLHLALAAYNAGPQRVDQHQDVPPIQETRDFVRNVCANFLQYANEHHPEPKVVVSHP